MVGSKLTRSKTVAMAQSVTTQSYSSHDPAANPSCHTTATTLCDWNHRADLYHCRTISRSHGQI
ncbi:unnamed protein product [Prunus armeniaca]